MQNSYFPILIVVGVAIILSGAFIIISSLLGSKKPTQSKLSPYECGIPTEGQSGERFSVKFFLVAILFILFDVEAVFLYPWALYLKDSIQVGKGFFIFWQMALFLVILTLGLFYVWKRKALDWEK